jgi:hypothetical protein
LFSSKKFLAAILIPVTLSACATPYSGGVEAQMITNDTARISARGNRYTPNTSVVDFVLLKAAETSLAHGFTHFTILNAANASQIGTVTTPGYVTNVYGNTIYNPGTANTFIEPGQDLIVRFCKEEKEKCPGLLANEIVQNLGPRYLAKQ